jgi:twitching motility protein PilU
MDIQDYFKLMVEKEASDLYLAVGRAASYRIEGAVQTIGEQVFKPDDLAALAQSFMTPQQWEEFNQKLEMNLALSLPGVSRFRVNVYRQRGSVSMVIRRVKVEILSVEELGIPSVLKDIVMSKRGLVLIVGATGSGKSTTLAAMIDYRNSNESGHILTIEDPIEFVHRHKNSVVTQRELGFDTHSYQDALKNSLRQAPDVVLIGEIRDSETMETAITLADTGHLCLATLHSTNAHQAFERILNLFPESRHPQTLMQLSMNLRAIISQRLIPTLEGKRAAAVEILIDTPRIKDLIKKGEVDSLKDAMEQSIQEGCQTFDHALFTLSKEGKISMEHALANADSANNLRLKFKLGGYKGDGAAEEVARMAEKEKKSGFQIKGR